MSSYNVHAGEARFPRGRRFQPQGRLSEETPRHAASEGRRAEPVSRLSARLFVGLNVGTKTVWNERAVVDAVLRIRREQGAAPGATILSQRGIYEDSERRVIDEPSVQIIILDFAGTELEVFREQMLSLGETLSREFQQEEVLLEIQRRGIVEEQYTCTPD